MRHWSLTRIECRPRNSPRKASRRLPGGAPQVLDPRCRIDHEQLAQGSTLKLRRESLHHLPLKDLPGATVTEGDNHA